MVPRGRLELWLADAILSCKKGGVAKIYSHFYSQQLPLLSDLWKVHLFVYAAAADQRLVLILHELGQLITKQSAGLSGD